jgi:spore coat polysaccharide biosynthesis protein SpsF (cytidylyltransferase family)
MTGIFIVARLGSTRLSQKHLIKAAGKSFIEWLALRFLTAFQKEIATNKVCVFIVPSERLENKEFEEVFAAYPKVKIFYGSDSNIPLRQLQCAHANNINEIISIDGDDILCSVDAALEVREALLHGCSCAKTSGLPLGVNVMGYKTSFLEAALKNSEQSVLETGWGRIFEGTNMKEIRMGEYDKDARLRFTLDYDADAQFFSAIINELGEKTIEAKDQSIVDLVLEKHLYELNENLNAVYWQNFNQKKEINK